LALDHLLDLKGQMVRKSMDFGEKSRLSSFAGIRRTRQTVRTPCEQQGEGLYPRKTDMRKKKTKRGSKKRDAISGQRIRRWERTRLRRSARPSAAEESQKQGEGGKDRRRRDKRTFA